MQPTAKRRLEYVPDPNRFDLTVQRWNFGGELVANNPYRTHVLGDKTYFERPVNSGNLWHENNQPAGRVNYEFGPSGKISKKTYDFEASHLDWKAPATPQEQAQALFDTQAENAALKAELEAIRKEKVQAQADVGKTQAKEVKNFAPGAEPKATPTLTKRG